MFPSLSPPGDGEPVDAAARRHPRASVCAYPRPRTQTHRGDAGPRQLHRPSRIRGACFPRGSTSPVRVFTTRCERRSRGSFRAERHTPRMATRAILWSGVSVDFSPSTGRRGPCFRHAEPRQWRERTDVSTHSNPVSVRVVHHPVSTTSTGARLSSVGAARLHQRTDMATGNTGTKGLIGPHNDEAA